MAFRYSVPLSLYGWTRSKSYSNVLAGYSAADTVTIGRSGSSANYINRAASLIGTTADAKATLQGLRKIYKASAADITSITLNMTFASSMSGASTMFCGVKALDDTTPQIVKSATVSVPASVTSTSIDITSFGLADLDSYMGWGIGGSTNSYRYTTLLTASVDITSAKAIGGGFSGSIIVDGVSKTVAGGKLFVSNTAYSVSGAKVYSDGEWK